MKVENLLVSLSELVTHLYEGGKDDSANFFSHKIKQINNSLEDKQKLDLIIQELMTCKAIAQYANFSLSEEKYLAKVIDDAIICSRS